MCILEGNATLTLDLALTGLNAEYMEISGVFFETLQEAKMIILSFPSAVIFVTCIHAFIRDGFFAFLD